MLTFFFCGVRTSLRLAALVLDLRNDQRAAAALDALAADTCAPYETAVLEFAQGVTDARVGALAAACGGSLRRLNLNACQALTDAAVEAVAERCPLLESLSLYWDVRIGEGWLLARRAEEMHAN